MSFEELMVPTQAVVPEADRVLVFAPHPDDEVFGCGGTLAALLSSGASVKIIVLTGGEDQVGDCDGSRQVESCKAAEIIGYAKPDFWSFCDRQLLKTASLKERMRGAIEEFEPNLVFAPSIWEVHPDHRATAQFAAESIQMLANDIELWMYEVGQPLSCNRLVDITEFRDIKSAAMAQFQSQLEFQLYNDQIEGLNRYRTYTLPKRVIAAEAFYVVPASAIGLMLGCTQPDFLSDKVSIAEQKLELARQNYTELEKGWGELNEALIAERKRVTQLESQLDELAKGWGDLDEALAAERKRVAQLESQLDEPSERWNNLDLVHRDLTESYDSLRCELDTIIESNSWRMTRPFRGIRRKLLHFKWAISNWPQTLRSVWRRLPLGAEMKIRLRVLPRKLEQAVWNNISSPNNAAAHQSQLDRRSVMSIPAAQSLHLDDYPNVDISIVTYNSTRHLKDFILSLTEQRYPLERISLSFVDNGSNDETVNTLLSILESVKERFRGVSFTQSTNRGFGAGHNLAISQGCAPYILVVNPDTIFESDSLQALLETAVRDESDVACWESRQYPFEHPKHYDPVTREANWCSHACILLRRDAYEQVGRYDERIFLYGEDVEFSYRLRANGFLLRYCPESVIRHYTYEYSGEVKPAQYVGSLLGNFFIRTRYGSWKDYLMIYPLLMVLLLRRPFVGARRALLSGFFGRFFMYQFSLRAEGLYRRGMFPLRGLDYSLGRKGPFYMPQREVLGACKNLPKVSVLTRTVAGRAQLLRQAGASVLGQTYPNIEWVVVEDGGSSQAEVVSQIKSDKIDIRYFSLSKVGRSAAGNEAMRQATGEWLMFLDDDDLLYADHVEVLVGELLSKPNAVAAYSLAWEVPSLVEAGGEMIIEAEYHQVKGLMQPYDPERLEHMNFIPIQAILFQRSLFEERGGFNVEIDHLEDWNLWSRYSVKNLFVYVEKTTSLYRVPLRAEERAKRQQALDEAYSCVKAINDIERERYRV
jgi:GT2 family glycosyltransferase/LmbE family N-acetylglucosaminyl deacetylase